MKKEEVVSILKQHGCILDEEKIIPHGVQLIFRNGAIVCVYKTGKISVQGKHFDVVSKLLGQSAPDRPTVAVANNSASDDVF